MTKRYLSKLKSKFEKMRAIEKQLTSRLRNMGLLLIFFGLCSLSYAIFDPTDAEADEEKEIEVIFDYPGTCPSKKVSKPNYYLISFIFAIIGGGIIAIAWRNQCKKKS